MTTPEPVGQQGRWLDLLSEYDIDIKHRPGRVHSNTDALSRRPCERSGGQACQQCLQTIAASGAARATGVEVPTTGLSPTIGRSTADTAELVLGGVL